MNQGSPAADQALVLVVEDVRDGVLAQPVLAEGLDLGPGERPGHLAGVVVLVAGARDDQQPAAGRDQLGGPREGRAPRRAGERLQGAGGRGPRTP